MDNFIFYVKKYGKDFLTFLLIFIILALLIYQSFFQEENTKTPEFREVAVVDDDQVTEKLPQDSDILSMIHVDVKGAVKKPGVYEISENAILNDVIIMAGGFNNNAHQNSINLSKKVKDEMVLYIYTKDEIKKYEEESLKKVNTTECSVADYVICDCTENKQSVIVPETNEFDESNNEDLSNISNNEAKRVNINTANQEELMTISGIGAAKAQDIITY